MPPWNPPRAPRAARRAPPAPPPGTPPPPWGRIPTHPVAGIDDLGRGERRAILRLDGFHRRAGQDVAHANPPFEVADAGQRNETAVLARAAQRHTRSGADPPLPRLTVPPEAEVGGGQGPVELVEAEDLLLRPLGQRHQEAGHGLGGADAQTGVGPLVEVLAQEAARDLGQRSPTGIPGEPGDAGGAVV